MTTFRGEYGYVKLSEVIVAQIDSWVLDTSAEFIDRTEVSDKWIKGAQGDRYFTVELHGFIDMGDTTGQRALIDEIVSSQEDGFVPGIVLTVASTGVVNDDFIYFIREKLAGKYFILLNLSAHYSHL